ncbi:MAG: galactokinase [Spirochaetia bacterium]|jgi:galactokinase|nr:galactokinase [Spirochaetia bacterium]
MATITDIKNGNLHGAYPNLYGSSYDEEALDARFIELVRTHGKEFGQDSVQLYSTAGRSELGGNHTDHNQGKVLAATINLDTIAAVHATDQSSVILKSEGFPIVKVDLSDLSMHEKEKNTTDALVRGIAKAFHDRGLKVGGFMANTSTSVLKGSGLSSSAAIEVLCATIFNHLFNNDKLTPLELAIIGQYAENEYYGKPSGLMDQVACAEGGIVAIDFKETKSPKVTALQYDFASHGYALVIVDTKGSHEDLTANYASIPHEMKEVAGMLGGKHLRDITEKSFMEQLPTLRTELKNDRALLRAFHFFSENERVTKMVEALGNDDFNYYLSLVNECGRSSFCFLQNLYADYRQQGLPLALALSEDLLQGKGACRVHGGGFAGTIQAYVPVNMLKAYQQRMDTVFGKGSVTELAIRPKESCCFAE